MDGNIGIIITTLYMYMYATTSTSYIVSVAASSLQFSRMTISV